MQLQRHISSSTWPHAQQRVAVSTIYCMTWRLHATNDTRAAVGWCQTGAASQLFTAV
jgi:hypothetical protein